MTEVPESTLNLHRIINAMDRAGMRTRDFNVLFVISQDPGISSNAICPRLSIPMRSMVRDSLARLEQWGLVEDRRIRAAKAVMTRLHVTEKGLKLLQNPLQIYDIINEPEGL